MREIEKQTIIVIRVQKVAVASALYSILQKRRSGLRLWIKICSFIIIIINWRLHCIRVCVIYIFISNCYLGLSSQWLSQIIGNWLYKANTHLHAQDGGADLLGLVLRGRAVVTDRRRQWRCYWMQSGLYRHWNDADIHRLSTRRRQRLH